MKNFQPMFELKKVVSHRKCGRYKVEWAVLLVNGQCNQYSQVNYVKLLKKLPKMRAPSDSKVFRLKKCCMFHDQILRGNVGDNYSFSEVLNQ